MSRIIQYWRMYNPYLPTITISLIIIILVFLCIFWFRVRKSSAHMSFVNSFVECMITMYVFLMLFFTLLPRDNNYRIIKLQPTIENLFMGDIEYLLNVLLFIPLSLLISLKFKRATLVLIICLIVSLLIETLQFYLNIGRISSIDDVIMNVLGVFIGILLAAIGKRTLKLFR